MNENTARSAYLQDSGYRSKTVQDLLLQEIVISFLCFFFFLENG